MVEEINRIRDGSIDAHVGFSIGSIVVAPAYITFR